MPTDPASIAAIFDDPRISPPFLRSSGDILLLGVVHDHPASVARVRTLIEALEPDVLALELPPVAVPLYRSYAVESSQPPRFGGEMSQAIAATNGAQVVGIDGPNRTFVTRLFRRLVAERVPLQTVKRLLGSVARASREALTCRLAATVCGVTSLTIIAETPIEYSCSVADSPERQAEHERAHVAAVQTLLAESDRQTVRYRDETREACMIDRLESLREDGSVVAVVGMHHLDALEAGLSG